jgi:hypothetical protein
MTSKVLLIGRFVPFATGPCSSTCWLIHLKVECKSGHQFVASLSLHIEACLIPASQTTGRNVFCIGARLTPTEPQPQDSSYEISVPGDNRVSLGNDKDFPLRDYHRPSKEVSSRNPSRASSQCARVLHCWNLARCKPKVRYWARPGLGKSRRWLGLAWLG